MGIGEQAALGRVDEGKTKKIGTEPGLQKKQGCEQLP